MKFKLLLLLSFLLSSCYHIKTKSVIHPYSLDEIKIAKDNVIEKLNIEKVQTPDSIETYVSGETLYGFRNILEKINEDSTKVNFITTSPSVKVANNLNITFHSFLEQELAKVKITEENKNFLKLTPKTKEEYKIRNWIFMPYGYSYLGEGNPFANSEDHTANKIFLSLIEVGHYALIVGGPFIGKSNKDKVMIPLIGLSGLVAWKFMIPWLQGNRQIDSFNGIAKSGYFVPTSVK